jgi:2-polyprenyl-3-methyl-5-hydroxy-6-metoxy-1,4-benzoquinol methylase
MERKPDPFLRRSQLQELIDEPCPEEAFIGAMRDLKKANRILRAHRPTLLWLERHVAKADRPCVILDVGCGAGDMLQGIESWARARRLELRLVGVDINSSAIEEAQRSGRQDSIIEWRCGDALDLSSDMRVDFIICSLFTHHLAEEEIARLVNWMESTAQRGWFISDLERTRFAYYGFKALARVMRWHPYVQNDGPLSVLRSFTTAEWRVYLQRAGVEPRGVTIYRSFPGRICVSRLK